MVVVIVALVFASDVWAKVDARIEEAAKDSIGLDTAVSNVHAVKTVALMFVSTFSAVLTAYATAWSSDWLLKWWDAYTGERNEACNDDNNYGQPACNGKDANGTGVTWDWIIVHGLITDYFTFVMWSISFGGFIFYLIFNPLDDTPECNFDVDRSHYDGVQAIIGSISDYDTCLANIDDIFKKIDMNNDGTISRCEDAAFQHYMGSTREYAGKFSSEFSAASARALCAEDFEKPYVKPDFSSGADC